MLVLNHITPRTQRLTRATCWPCCSKSLRKRPLQPFLAATEAADRQVFQLYPTLADTCILDVRDAREVCSLARTPEEKKACYAVFGLDAERVDKYYSTVVLLEETLGKVEKVNEDTTPLTVKVFTVAVNVAAAVLAFVIAVLTVFSTFLTDTLKVQREAALHR